MDTHRRPLVLLLLLTLVAALLVVAAPRAEAALHSRYFQMPSKNIGCAIYNKALRCDILSGLDPEPSGNCDGDWTGLYLESKGGKANPVCAGDTVYKQNAKILKYGHKWKRGGIVCRSKTTGLRCKNSKGHGFFLSRDDWDVF